MAIDQATNAAEKKLKPITAVRADVDTDELNDAQLERVSAGIPAHYGSFGMKDHGHKISKD